MAGDARICEVWEHNLVLEMKKICEQAVRYNYVAVDAEFPGVVVRPMNVGGGSGGGGGGGGVQRTSLYHTVRANVDLLSIIQLGITLCDGQGKYPAETCTWQFNFRFDLKRDMFAQDSVDLLAAHGLDFERHAVQGIEPLAFAELFIASGLVLMDNITWVSFHGIYDFAYLIKVLTTLPLPHSEAEYFQLLSLYFPRFFDLKVLFREADKYHGGLNAIAEQLGVTRIGTTHQAGSDSLLTMSIYWRLAMKNFDGVAAESLLGALYGLGAHIIAHYALQVNPAPGVVNADNATAALPPEQTTPNGNHSAVLAHASPT